MSTMGARGTIVLGGGWNTTTKNNIGVLDIGQGKLTGRTPIGTYLKIDGMNWNRTEKDSSTAIGSGERRRRLREGHQRHDGFARPPETLSEIALLLGEVQQRTKHRHDNGK